jgi:hypothetical protein
MAAAMMAAVNGPSVKWAPIEGPPEFSRLRLQGFQIITGILIRELS